MGAAGRRLRRAAAVTAVLAGLLAQGGCALVSIDPAWELVKAASSAATVAAGAHGARASLTVHHGAAMPAKVCIAYDPRTPLEDFVPALQIELKRLDVDSRVFGAVEADVGCPHWLQYRAAIGWDTPPLSNQRRIYLREAVLSLQTPEGRVLSSSRYLADGMLTGQWASTREKLAPVVLALLTGFEN